MKLTKFQLADQKDAVAIKRYVEDRQNWNPLYLYHAPGVPTFAGAVDMAQASGLSSFFASPAKISQADGGDFLATVEVPTGPEPEAGPGQMPTRLWPEGSPIVTR